MIVRRVDKQRSIVYTYDGVDPTRFERIKEGGTEVHRNLVRARDDLDRECLFLPSVWESLQLVEERK